MTTNTVNWDVFKVSQVCPTDKNCEVLKPTGTYELKGKLTIEDSFLTTNEKIDKDINEIIDMMYQFSKSKSSPFNENDGPKIINDEVSHLTRLCQLGVDSTFEMEATNDYVNYESVRFDLTSIKQQERAESEECAPEVPGTLEELESLTAQPTPASN